jgi:chromosomal replication initiator protein
MTIQPTEIIEKVSAFYRPELERLYTRSRFTDVRKVRQVSMFFMKDFTKLTWREIGDYFNRDHATAIHSYKVVMNECQTNADYRNEITELRGSFIKISKNNKIIPVEYVLMEKFGKQLIPLT